MTGWLQLPAQDSTVINELEAFPEWVRHERVRLRDCEPLMMSKGCMRAAARQTKHHGSAPPGLLEATAGLRPRIAGVGVELRCAVGGLPLRALAASPAPATTGAVAICSCLPAAAAGHLFAYMHTSSNMGPDCRVTSVQSFKKGNAPCYSSRITRK